VTGTENPFFVVVDDDDDGDDEALLAYSLEFHGFLATPLFLLSVENEEGDDEDDDEDDDEAKAWDVSLIVIATLTTKIKVTVNRPPIMDKV
jgi:hypothetical protein